MKANRHNSVKVLKRTIIVSMMGMSSAWAATEQEGLQACADAAMAELSGESTMPVYSVINLKPGRGGRLGSMETFHIDARGAQSDALLGRYACKVNRKAEVIELSRVPMEDQDSAARAVGMN